MRSPQAWTPPDSCCWTRLADVPVDVLVGEHDVFLPPATLERAVTRRLAGASFGVVPRAGHLLPHERPGAIVEVLRTRA
jgi:pimeloyl-ACP methyl ester carboxylesterase